MREIEEYTRTQIGEMCENGTVEAIIKEQLEKSVTRAVERSMGWSSDFAKGLQKRVEDCLGLAIHQIDLTSYQAFVADTASDVFNEHMDTHFAEQLRTSLSEILEPVPAEDTFSNLIGFIAKAWRDTALDFNQGQIEIEATTQEAWAGPSRLEVVIADPCGGEKTHATFYDHGDGWKVGYIAQDKRPLIPRAASLAASPTNSVARRLFQYWARQTVFEPDATFETIAVFED